jgi:hypothetical protein
MPAHTHYPVALSVKSETFDSFPDFCMLRQEFSDERKQTQISSPTVA